MTLLDAKTGESGGELLAIVDHQCVVVGCLDYAMHTVHRYIVIKKMMLFVVCGIMRMY